MLLIIMLVGAHSALFRLLPGRPLSLALLAAILSVVVMKHNAHVLELVLVAAVLVGGLLACSRSTTSPSAGPLAIGRWTGGGACLSVTDAGCNLAVGCGHGQFSRPIIRADGTFDVDGTYRIEVGPVSIEPAPPAHFSGSMAGARLILTVVPSAGSLQPASYSMTPTSAGTCPTPCV